MDNQNQPVQNFVNLLDYNNNIIFNMTPEEVSAAIISGDASRVRKIEGQFAIVEKVGQAGIYGAFHRKADALFSWPNKWPGRYLLWQNEWTKFTIF